MGNGSDRPIIGIVGGMGPYAGLDLAQKVLDHTDAAADQDHVPMALVSLSDRIGDRSAFLEGRLDVNPAIQIVSALERLEAAGASVAGMACVTAHAEPILSVIRQLMASRSMKVRLISIVEATIAYIRRRHPAARAVAALSTNGTFHGGVFLNMLERDGFHVIRQSDAIQQELVQDAIFNRDYGIKARSHPVTERAARQIEEAIRHVQEQGAEVVILGCTELPLAVRLENSQAHGIVDCTLALALGLLQETYPERIRMNPA